MTTLNDFCKRRNLTISELIKKKNFVSEDQFRLFISQMNLSYDEDIEKYFPKDVVPPAKIQNVENVKAVEVNNEPKTFEVIDSNEKVEASTKSEQPKKRTKNRQNRAPLSPTNEGE